LRRLILLASLLLAGCGGAANKSSLTPGLLATADWGAIEKQARGTAVSFAMWAGDEDRNRYFQGPAAHSLRESHDISLEIRPLGDTADVVNKLLNEKAAGKTTNGSVDVIWINGENFRTLKQGALLWGPFAERLPNVRQYDPEARQKDFGMEIDGYEAPWQRAQFVMAYDTSRVKEPPRSIERLRAWVRQHPGRFTYLAPPDFVGSAFLRHVLIHFGGDARRFAVFDEELYRRASAATIAYLNEIKPFLWRKGETYPATTREQDRLFVNNEIDFAMSFGASFASVRIARGEYPATTRTLLFDEGTIGNYNFLAIPFNAANVPGALVAINHFLNFEQLLELSRSLSGTFPLRLATLSPQQRAAVRALPRGPATLPAEELEAHFLPEPDARYLLALEKDWREKVLRP